MVVCPGFVCLTGCASAPVASGMFDIGGRPMGEMIPQWMGGLPADVPPRPGTPAYDAWMAERERQALTPKTGPSTPPAAPADTH
jgi:hypothetical protein